MPDTVASPLTEKEIAARREATRDAVASARIEGMVVSAAARSFMDLIAAVRQLHAGC